MQLFQLRFTNIFTGFLVFYCQQVFLEADNFHNPSFLSTVKKMVYNSLFCYDLSLPLSISDSLHALKKEIHGQPLVVNFLIPMLEKHFKTNFRPDSKLKKPLVLKFNGPTGVGKTFVAEHLLKSEYFLNKNFFPLSLHHSASASSKNDKEGLRHLKEIIHKAILESVSSCKRSIFVFDDITMVPPDFFDDMPPFKLPTSNKLNFNESLFIFISQNDSDAISATTSNLVKNGRRREDLEISEFLSSLNNEISGIGIIGNIWSAFLSYWNNDTTTTKSFIDLYIPFLPLEPSHVKKCIENDIGTTKLTSYKNLFEDVLFQVHCTPESEFCPFGCKLVHSKTAIALDRHEEL